MKRNNFATKLESHKPEFHEKKTRLLENQTIGYNNLWQSNENVILILRFLVN